MPGKEVALLVPQFRTEKMTKLCLRLLRLHTDLSRVEIIVIDNDSKDASLDYLRKLPWIKLIERHDISDETPAVSHAKALDTGLAAVSAPYVLSIHTDTLILSDDWLDYLLSFMKDFPNRAGVGSWKLEKENVFKKTAKKIEDLFRFYVLAPFKGRKIGENPYKDHYYLRSHCALYRTELLRKHTNGFLDGNTAGKSAHKLLEKAGFEMLFLPSEELGKYIRHLNHATLILHPELGGKRTSKPSARRKLSKELKAMHCDDVLADDSLDGI